MAFQGQKSAHEVPSKVALSQFKGSSNPARELKQAAVVQSSKVTQQTLTNKKAPAGGTLTLAATLQGLTT